MIVQIVCHFLCGDCGRPGNSSTQRHRYTEIDVDRDPAASAELMRPWASGPFLNWIDGEWFQPYSRAEGCWSMSCTSVWDSSRLRSCLVQSRVEEGPRNVALAKESALIERYISPSRWAASGPKKQVRCWLEVEAAASIVLASAA